MNELFEFELPEFLSKTVLIVGIGTEGAEAVKYTEKKGIKGGDFLVLNRNITEEELVQYKLVFVLSDLSDLVSIGIARDLADKTDELFILTIGVIVFPQSGKSQKTNQLSTNLDSSKSLGDLLIIISEEQILNIDIQFSLFSAIENIHHQIWLAVKTITDLAFVPGIVSVDFADIHQATRNSGFGFITTGEASGENKAIIAIAKAVQFSWLISEPVSKAKSILMRIVFGTDDITINELTEIFDFIEKVVNEDCNILWDCSSDPEIGNKVRITIVGTVFEKLFSGTS